MEQLPAELALRVFSQLLDYELPDDAAPGRVIQHPWTAPLPGWSLLFHPDAMSCIGDQRDTNTLQKEITRFGAVCWQWKAVMADFRKRLVSVDVSSLDIVSGELPFYQQYLSFTAHHFPLDELVKNPRHAQTSEGRQAKHLQLISFRPVIAPTMTLAEKEHRRMEEVGAIMGLTGQSLVSLTLTEATIDWFPEVLAQLPRGPAQLQSVCLLVGAALLPEAAAQLARCTSLRELRATVGGKVRDCSGAVTILNAARDLRHLRYVQIIDVGAGQCGNLKSIKFQGALRTLRLDVPGIPLLHAVRFAEQFASTLQALEIDAKAEDSGQEYNDSSDPSAERREDSAKTPPFLPAGFPKVAFLKLTAMSRARYLFQAPPRIGVRDLALQSQGGLDAVALILERTPALESLQLNSILVPQFNGTSLYLATPANNINNDGPVQAVESLRWAINSLDERVEAGVLQKVFILGERPLASDEVKDLVGRWKKLGARAFLGTGAEWKEGM